MQTLKRNQQLNDNIVNSFIDLLERTNQKTDVMLCRTYFLAKVLELQEDTTGTFEWRIHHQLPKTWKSLIHIQRIFLPLLYFNHYSFFEVNLKDRQIIHYDSLEGELNLDAIECLINYWIFSGLIVSSYHMH